MSAWRRWRSVLRRLREVERGSVGLLAEAFLLLVTAKLALRVVPVRRIIGWRQAQAVRGVPGDVPGAVRRVRWAVLVVSRYAPVTFVCFPQCLAASELLRRRGVETRLHYGAARVDDKLVTHTWLEAAGEAVIGGEEAGAFSTLAVY